MKVLVKLSRIVKVKQEAFFDISSANDIEDAKEKAISWAKEHDNQWADTIISKRPRYEVISVEQVE